MEHPDIVEFPYRIEDNTTKLVIPILENFFVPIPLIYGAMLGTWASKYAERAKQLGAEPKKLGRVYVLSMHIDNLQAWLDSHIPNLTWAKDAERAKYFIAHLVPTLAVRMAHDPTASKPKQEDPTVTHVSTDRVPLTYLDKAINTGLLLGYDVESSTALSLRTATFIAQPERVVGTLKLRSSTIRTDIGGDVLANIVDAARKSGTKLLTQKDLAKILPEDSLGVTRAPEVLWHDNGRPLLRTPGQLLTTWEKGKSNELST